MWELSRVKGLPLDHHLEHADATMDVDSTTLGDVKSYDSSRLGQRPSASETSQMKVVEVALGFNHALARTRGGAVYSWGKGERGQLGLGLSMGASVEGVSASGKQLVAARVVMPWEVKRRGIGESVGETDTCSTSQPQQKVVRICAGMQCRYEVQV